MSKIIKLPGLIDIHVHLRDPGQTYKEDFYSGTCAALAGGVTTVFDMPNNIEPIFSYKKLTEKMTIAGQKAVCDFGLYFGTDGKNTDEFSKVQKLVTGLKIYLNLTTGKYLVDDEKLVEKVFQTWPKDKVIIVHAEGDKIDLAIDLCRKYKNKLHITHVVTRNDLEKIMDAKLLKLSITCDVTPHHLFLTEKDLPYLDGFGEVKPSLASQSDADFLWDNLKFIDCIATDHAPHTLAEKKSFDPPSGMPGLETMLPLLLTAVSKNRISLEDIVRLTNINPQRIFGFKQEENTYVEVDTEEKYMIKGEELETKCGWSPYKGWKVKGKVKNVFIRGTKVFSEEKVLVTPGFGKNIPQ
ncbi:hypothetical protein A3D03_01515 [Candidatus Gottesmanbacteria bacterium RIFCSPHIGHO2_02_FULL_40_13]|uniref:Amidohydrolase-related domain-containing protein n=1 Tax=Candidatus Gottesmanbacteria bacterium RIFCSPHIGHO2_02_FULL_40_13 TaxID=1798384 RepID=A0A1F6AAA1_9BACT|nr:MAG: hypothetical protein A3D03_01515 [Candidatus Gottesmanbacteria bacterium RIFCSPHIGHO2_02_FULL_40_13]